MPFRISNFNQYLQERKRRINRWILTSPLLAEAFSYDPIKDECFFDQPQVPITIDQEDINYLNHFPVGSWGQALDIRRNELFPEYCIQLRQRYIIEQLEKLTGRNVLQHGKVEWNITDKNFVAKLSEAIKNLNTIMQDKKNIGKRKIFPYPITLAFYSSKNNKKAPYEVIYEDGKVKEERWSVVNAMTSVIPLRILESNGFDPSVWSAVKIIDHTEKWYFVKSNMGKYYDRFTKAVNTDALAGDMSVEKRQEYLKKYGSFGLVLAYMERSQNRCVQKKGQEGQEDQEDQENQEGQNKKQKNKVPKPKVQAQDFRGVFGGGTQVNILLSHLNHGWLTTEEEGVNVIWDENTNKFLTKERTWTSQLRDAAPYNDEFKLPPGAKLVTYEFARIKTKDYKNNTELQRLLNTVVKQDYDASPGKVRVRGRTSESTWQLKDNKKESPYYAKQIGYDGDSETGTGFTNPDFSRAKKEHTGTISPVFTGPTKKEDQKEFDKIKQIFSAKFKTTAEGVRKNYRMRVEAEDESQAKDLIKDKFSPVSHLSIAKLEPGKNYLIVGEKGIQQINNKINMDRNKAIAGYFTSLKNPIIGRGMVPFNPLDLDKENRTKITQKAIDDLISSSSKLMYSTDTSKRVLPYIETKPDASKVTSCKIDSSTVETPFAVPSAVISSDAHAKWDHYMQTAKFLNDRISEEKLEDDDLDQERKKELNYLLNLLKTPDSDKDKLQDLISSTEKELTGYSSSATGDAKKERLALQKSKLLLKSILDLRTNYIEPARRWAAREGQKLSNDAMVKEIKKYMYHCQESARKVREKTHLFYELDMMRLMNGSSVEYGDGMVGLGTGEPSAGKHTIGGDPQDWHDKLKKYFGYLRAGDVEGDAAKEKNYTFESAQFNQYGEGNGKYTRLLGVTFTVKPFAAANNEDVVKVVNFVKQQIAQAEANNDEPRANGLRHKLQQLRRYSPTALTENIDEIIELNRKEEKDLFEAAIKLANKYTIIRERINPNLSDEALSVIKTLTDGQDEFTASNKQDQETIDKIYDRRDVLSKEKILLTKDAKDVLQAAHKQLVIAVQVYQQGIESISKKTNPSSRETQQMQVFQNLTELGKQHIKSLEEQHYTISQEAMPVTESVLPLTGQKRKMTAEEKKEYFSRQQQHFNTLVNKYRKSTNDLKITIEQGLSKKSKTTVFEEEEMDDSPILRQIRYDLEKQLENADENSTRYLEAKVIYEELDVLVTGIEEYVIRNLGHGSIGEYLKASKPCEQCHGSGNINNEPCPNCKELTTEQLKLLTGVEVWNQIKRLTHNYIGDTLQQDFGQGTRKEREKRQGNFLGNEQTITDAQDAANKAHDAISKKDKILGRTSRSPNISAKKLHGIRTILESHIRQLGECAELAEKAKQEQRIQAEKNAKDKVANIDKSTLSSGVENVMFSRVIYDLTFSASMLAFWKEYWLKHGYDIAEAMKLAAITYEDNKFNPYFTVKKNLEKLVEQIEQIENGNEPLPHWEDVVGKTRNDLDNPIEFRKENIVAVMKSVAIHQQVPPIAFLTHEGEKGKAAPTNYAYTLLEQWRGIYKTIQQAEVVYVNQVGMYPANDVDRKKRDNEIKEVEKQIKEVEKQVLKLEEAQEESKKNPHIPKEPKNPKEELTKEELEELHKLALSHRNINIRIITEYMLAYVASKEHDMKIQIDPKCKPEIYSFSPTDLRITQPTEGETPPSHPRFLQVARNEISFMRVSPQESRIQNEAWRQLLKQNFNNIALQIFQCPKARFEIHKIIKSGIYTWIREASPVRWEYPLENDVLARLTQAMNAANTGYAKYDPLKINGLNYNPGQPQNCKYSYMCNQASCVFHNKTQLPPKNTSAPKTNLSRDMFTASLIRATQKFNPQQFQQPRERKLWGQGADEIGSNEFD